MLAPAPVRLLLEVAAQALQVLRVVLGRGAGQALDHVGGRPRGRRAGTSRARPTACATDTASAVDITVLEPLHGLPVRGLAGAQLAEGGDQHLEHVLGRRHRHARAREQPRGLLAHQGELGLEVGDREHRLEVEAALERARSSR